MPRADTLERFIACVESNAPVEAIERFHADDSTMRETQQPPSNRRQRTENGD